jgi:peroxiredoxin
MAEKGLSQQLEECTERCRKMDAPLAVRLQTFADDVRRLSPEFADIVERMVARLKNTHVGESAPMPGEPMPEFVLPDQHGHLVTLDALTQNGPAVIAFHRGHWCPYCRINAEALVAIQSDIKNMGADLVAITPEIERFGAELAGGNGSGLRVLSDINNGYALLLNLAFFVGEEKRQAMTAAGWDITQYQGDDDWTLPIPATFVVGQDRIVKARFIDPDYRRRAGLEDILAALKAERH